jgi:rod shape-determining protein MreD
MAVVILILATYFAAVLQTALVPAFEVRHVMPDLLALVAIVWQLLTGWRRGFVAMAMVGLAYDLTSAGRLGVGLGLFALVGFAVAWLRTKLDVKHVIVRLAVVWLATTSIAIAEIVVCRLLAETTLAWASLVVRAVGVGVYTTGVALPLLMIVGWLGEGRRQGASGA